MAASKRAVAFRLEDPGPLFEGMTQIGQGSSGLVYAAVSRESARSVAIKRLDMGKQVSTEGAGGLARWRSRRSSHAMALAMVLSRDGARDGPLTQAQRSRRTARGSAAMAEGMTALALWRCGGRRTSPRWRTRSR